MVFAIVLPDFLFAVDEDVNADPPLFARFLVNEFNFEFDHKLPILIFFFKLLNRIKTILTVFNLETVVGEIYDSRNIV